MLLYYIGLVTIYLPWEVVHGGQSDRAVVTVCMKIKQFTQ